MSTATIKHYSLDEYFQRLEESPHRLEYYDGEIFTMSGGTDWHGLIAMATSVSLYNVLVPQGGYRVYSGDTSFHCPTGLFTFPDATVVHGPGELVRHRGIDSIKNPLLVVEVLSRSTERYDRGDKFAHYKTIPTLRGYLLVAQNEPRVEHFARQPDDQWERTEAKGIDARVELPELGITLSLQNLYAQVMFPHPGETNDSAELTSPTDPHPPAPKQ